jgi:hypothetical protein
MRVDVESTAHAYATEKPEAIWGGQLAVAELEQKPLGPIDEPSCARSMNLSVYSGA